MSKSGIFFRHFLPLEEVVRVNIRVFVTFLLTLLLAGCHREAEMSPDERFHRMKIGFQRKYVDFERRCKTAKPGKEFAEVFATDPRPEYASRFLKLAKDNPTSPVAVDALIWVINNQPGTTNSIDAMKLAEDRYVSSRKMIQVMPELKFGSDTQSLNLLRALSKRSPHSDVRNFASLMLSEKLAKTCPEEAKMILRKLIEHADKEDPDGKIGVVARNELFDLEHLSVGLKAPELAGEDCNGKKIRLADYKGKVVLVSFFGDWCPACRSLFPHERSLVQQFKSKPFVVLGVSSDDRETLKAITREGTVTWTSVWDGGSKFGPISRAWNVRGWPTIYLIDRKGLIAYRGNNGYLDDQISRLIEEKP